MSRYTPNFLELDACKRQAFDPAPVLEDCAELGCSEARTAAKLAKAKAEHEKTPRSLTAAQTKEKTVKEKLEKAHDRAAFAWAEWLKAAAKNPVHQLSWGDAAMLHAARMDVFSSVLKNFDSRKISEWEQYAMERVMREALDPASSTSAMSNIMSKMQTKAWAEVVEMCEAV